MCADFIGRDGFTPAELLQVAGDLVEWVEGRVAYLAVGLTSVSVHVTTQADAEHLARLLSLGTVTDLPPDESGHGFMVWTSEPGYEPRYAVHCSGDLVRPVRAFPSTEPWWGFDGAEAA